MLATNAHKTKYGAAGKRSRFTSESSTGVSITAVVSSESTVVTNAPSRKALRYSARPSPFATRAHQIAAQSKKPLFSTKNESNRRARRNKSALFPASTVLSAC